MQNSAHTHKYTCTQHTHTHTTMFQPSLMVNTYNPNYSRRLRQGDDKFKDNLGDLS